MRCLSCKYSLHHLTNSGGGFRCPECGRAFNPHDFSTFESAESRDQREAGREIRWMLGGLAVSWIILFFILREAALSFACAVVMIPMVALVVALWAILRPARSS